MSTGGEEPQSPSKNESLSDGDADGDHAEEEAETRKTETKTSSNGPKKPSEFPALINRRSKIVNGNINPRDRKQVRNKGMRETERKIEDMMRERNGRNTDSGLGRVSAESVDSSTPEDPVRRRVWEQESGESGGGHRDGSRGGRAQAVGTAAKKEEMARLEKELEQELRYR